MKHVSLPTLLIALLVVVILVAYWVTFEVSFHDVVIRIRLGKAGPTSVIDDPGLRFRWPLIDNIVRYDTRIQVLDTPETEIKTNDGKQVIIGAYALWKVADPLVFYRSVTTFDEGIRDMRPRVTQALTAVVGRNALSDFVGLNPDVVDANYDRILGEVQDQLAADFMKDYGVKLEEIGIRRISLPQQTTQRIFESMQQERNKLATSLREQGKAEAAAIVARAQSEARQIREFARRRAQEIKSTGYQAAKEILAQIEQGDREFFEWLRWLDALQAALSQQTTIFIDQNWPLFGPFVNPPVPVDPNETR